MEKGNGEMKRNEMDEERERERVSACVMDSLVTLPFEDLDV